VAWHRPPGGAVVLVADDGANDSVLVNLANVGAIGDVHFAVGSHCNAFGISESGVDGLSAVAAEVGISRQAPFPVSDERFPVVFYFVVAQRSPVLGVGLDLLDPDDLVRFRLRDVHRLPLLKLVDQSAVRQMEPVRHPTRIEFKDGLNGGVCVDLPDDVVVGDVDGSVGSGGQGFGSQQLLLGSGAVCA